jgi:hypothetical protein
MGFENKLAKFNTHSQQLQIALTFSIALLAIGTVSVALSFHVNV